MFLASKITADGDCSYEVRRHLLLGRKAMTNLNSILKSRDITLPTRVRPRADLLQNGLVGSPCSPRDSQESSPTPQFKASVLQCSAFFIVQLSHPYMTTGKNIALTIQIFVGKVMSLLFNMLSRLVITFLPRSKPLLISWLQSPSAVILKPPKN